MKIKPLARKITVRFSKSLKSEMQAALIQSGYGLHGESRWVSEAITDFLLQSHFVDDVEHGMDVNQAELSEMEAFYLDHEIIQKIKSALMRVRVKYPLSEGVQSAIIRAAVIYKLMLK